MEASLRSSILDYRRENGCTYHRMSDGKYAFPNDDREQERLDIVNHVWMLTLEGNFCLCPKNNDGTARQVLDLGTGTGIWSIDFAEAHEKAEVLDVDLSPIQPEYVPPNCRFEIDDIEKEWAWNTRFDFIFCRDMNGSFSGYFEIQDSIWPPVCDDGTFSEDSALYKWIRLLVEASDKLGRPIDQTAQRPMMMQAIGFEDIRTTRVVFPVSPWPKDDRLRELGKWNLYQLLPGLEALTLGLLTRALGWSKPEVLVLCAHVRRDLQDTNIHAYWNGHVMYGRKPLNAPRTRTIEIESAP
ncbi:methyltransferase domain-containing protein [Colletotrichum asianum]|uniref:Methyltransferase domain-containing protein n=1 Tax=Colletotrichum asianum TaxID=702518 RepID=A0A8H3ZES3_9PEZI|nr:methyltransferase domain-containing protein [Colletotrichum asianum]